jgi:hypothetical protein
VEELLDEDVELELEVDDDVLLDVLDDDELVDVLVDELVDDDVELDVELDDDVLLDVLDDEELVELLVEELVDVVVVLDVLLVVEVVVVLGGGGSPSTPMRAARHLATVPGTVWAIDVHRPDVLLSQLTTVPTSTMPSLSVSTQRMLRLSMLRSVLTPCSMSPHVSVTLSPW